MSHIPCASSSTSAHNCFMRMSHVKFMHKLIATHMQHTATHCNTLQHTATHCNTLQIRAQATCVSAHTCMYACAYYSHATHCNAATNCNLCDYSHEHHAACWIHMMNIMHKYHPSAYMHMPHVDECVREESLL